MPSIFETKRDVSFRVADDDAAKLLLHELEMLHKFTDNPSLSEPWFEAVIELCHCSHYIFGLRFTGMASPAENGYVVDCLPKCKFSETQAVDFMKRQYEKCGIPGTWVFGIKSKSNSNN